MGVPATNFQNGAEAPGDEELGAAGDHAQAPEPADACRQLDALFCATRQRMLGLLLGQPDASFLASELIERTGSGDGAAHRELARLVASGLVAVRHRGVRRLYRANSQGPLYAELASMVRKSIGLAQPLREAFAPLARRVELAFVHEPIGGTINNGRRELEMLLVAEALPWAELNPVLEAAGRRLGRRIFALPLRKNEVAEPGRFVQQILAQPRVWVLGGEAQLQALLSPGP